MRRWCGTVLQSTYLIFKKVLCPICASWLNPPSLPGLGTRTGNQTQATSYICYVINPLKCVQELKFTCCSFLLFIVLGFYKFLIYSLKSNNRQHLINITVLNFLWDGLNFVQYKVCCRASHLLPVPRLTSLFSPAMLLCTSVGFVYIFSEFCRDFSWRAASKETRRLETTVNENKLFTLFSDLL